MARTKINNACERCRRQKLKCDVERPCIMCTRAGAQCVEREPRAWHVRTSRKTDCRLRKTGERSRRSGQGGQSDVVSFPAELGESDGHRGEGGGDDGAFVDERECGSERQGDFPMGGSSSTIMLVEEAFHHHDTTTPTTCETSALGYGLASSAAGMHPSPRRMPGSRVGSRLQSQFSRMSSSAAREVVSVLPDRKVVAMLVDNYFDKIHWFMLLFHQREFKQSLSCLYPEDRLESHPAKFQAAGSMGYASVLLAVCAISLRYTSTDQHNQLASYGIDHETLRERILTTLRLRLLDILALGSLEAVQMCVLLGSYYLFHGEPELAWPLCGCALRLGQALELHRRPAPLDGRLSHEGSFLQREIEERKRCWWAVHEIETFCSMIYGFPLSISDADCDTEALDPHDPWSIVADGQSTSDEPTLLMYKCSMSALSKIVKSALERLYRYRKNPDGRGSASSANEGSRPLQRMMEKVIVLDSELKKWYSKLPSRLNLGRLSGTTGVPPAGFGRNSIAFGQVHTTLSFDEQLYQLQALALKLAFENARILIYRPLLACKSNHSPRSTNTSSSSSEDPIPAFIHACRDAALQISWAGHTPIFQQASATYARNFISMHLLTAGITLCIMTSVHPLSQESFESKMGVRRVMEMQMALRENSIVADQGLRLLRRLLGLVMKRETDMMLQVGPQSTQGGVERVGGAGLEVDTSDLEPHGDHPSADFEAAPAMPTESSHISWQVNEHPQFESTTVADEFNSFDFYADDLMSQVMLDIEQGMALFQSY